MSIAAVFFVFLGIVMIYFGAMNLKADIQYKEESWITVMLVCVVAFGCSSFLAGVTSL